MEPLGVPRLPALSSVPPGAVGAFLALPALPSRLFQDVCQRSSPSPRAPRGSAPPEPRPRHPSTRVKALGKVSSPSRSCPIRVIAPRKLASRPGAKGPLRVRNETTHSCRRSRHSSFIEVFRYLGGAPEEIRTPDPQIRSLWRAKGQIKKRVPARDCGLMVPNEPGARPNSLTSPLEGRERTGVRFERERV
jgi:hypothetical protein